MQGLGNINFHVQLWQWWTGSAALLREKEKGKKILRCFFPCGIQSRSTSHIFQREKAESPFQLPSASESAFKRHPFEALQRAGEHAITEPR